MIFTTAHPRSPFGPSRMKMDHAPLNAAAYDAYTELLKQTNESLDLGDIVIR